MSNPVLVQRMPGLVQILLNRPDKKNAITACMYGLLADAITAAVADTSIKVIVLGSANEHFTAGNDLGDFLANPSLEVDSPVYRFLNALMYCPLPVVAAVQGFAIGIGATLLLHCDQVFADSSARFSFPFIDLGLVPEAGSTLLLPRQVGYQKAADLLLRGAAFSAQEACEMGLVSVLADSGVLHQATAYAQELACKPRAGLLAIKQLLKQDQETLQHRTERELDVFVQCLNSPAAKEAMSAFLEKRRPDFANL